jgi:hypothetical protein
VYGKLLLIQEQVLVLKSNRAQRWKASEESNSRGDLVKKRRILILHKNQEGQHKRPKWYYNMMYDVWEDEFPKEMEGRST